jgi:1-acyl-sn-glycerol-3-phosphate acyltransferase
MLRLLSKLIFKIAGWQMGPYMPADITKSVMLAAPHTSNWDLLFARCAFFIMEIPLRFTIKKEWMKFPFGLFMGPLGAIPVDRNPKGGGSLKKRNMVDVMADLFDDYEKVTILVTPEGTRSKTSRWKTGFYHTALKAGVPISLGYLDYDKKEAGIGKVVYPTGNFEKDMAEINEFYLTKKPKFPEKFSIHVGKS